jgi:3-phosphoinositide dependent protein kinase-1
MSDSSYRRKNTFVGTADYVSPELLSDKDISFEVDLWALGTIIYQMFAGTPPFRDKTEYITFKRIGDVDYSISEKFPEEAKDLIDKLLQKNPSDRLGSGSKGDQNDFIALKGHPFFKGINWEYLNQTPPHSDKFVILPKDIKCRPNHRPFTERHNTVQEVKSDIIEKKSPWFHYNTRKVVLDTSPRLEYIDPSKNIVKVNID